MLEIMLTCYCCAYCRYMLVQFEKLLRGLHVSNLLLTGQKEEATQPLLIGKCHMDEAIAHDTIPRTHITGLWILQAWEYANSSMVILVN